jgi:hypothetical protein
MLSIFNFHIDFCNDIGSHLGLLSLKKGTTPRRNHVPNSAKLISRKHVWPKSALLHKDFLGLGPNHFVGCPEFGKTHFPKTRLAEIGTVAQRFPGFGSKPFRRMSRIRQNSFPENTFGRNRHCCTKISWVWVQTISSDVPNSGKLISRKHVWPKSALLHKYFLGLGPNHFVGCPEFGKTHFPKTRLAENGTSMRAIRAFLPQNGNKCTFFLLEDFG